LTNKKGKGRKGALVGIIEGNKAEVAIKILKNIKKNSMDTKEEGRETNFGYGGILVLIVEK
jgi:hypothetical protein